MKTQNGFTLFEVLRAKILYRNTGKLRPKFDKNMGFVKFKKNILKKSI